MDLTVNGRRFSIDDGSCVLDLLSRQGLDPAVVVIEVNRSIVKKDLFRSHLLRGGDTVEILRFVGGG